MAPNEERRGKERSEFSWITRRELSRLEQGQRALSREWCSYLSDAQGSDGGEGRRTPKLFSALRRATRKHSTAVSAQPHACIQSL